jgi:hypothetical protein
MIAINQSESDQLPNSYLPLVLSQRFMKSAAAKMITPDERIKLRALILRHGLSEKIRAIKTTSATGKTIAKKVLETLASKLGKTGFIKKAVQIELTPSATMAESITSRIDEEKPCRSSLGIAINMNG